MMRTQCAYCATKYTLMRMGPREVILGARDKTRDHGLGRAFLESRYRQITVSSSAVSVEA